MHVKLVYQPGLRSGSEEDSVAGEKQIRRFRLAPDAKDKLKLVLGMARELFGLKEAYLQYLDEDLERIVVGSEEEMEDALRDHPKVAKFFVRSGAPDVAEAWESIELTESILGASGVPAPTPKIIEDTPPTKTADSSSKVPSDSKCEHAESSSQCNNESLAKVEEPMPVFEAGVSVRVTKGKYANDYGIITRTSRKQSSRWVVMLSKAKKQCAFKAYYLQRLLNIPKTDIPEELQNDEEKHSHVTVDAKVGKSQSSDFDLEEVVNGLLSIPAFVQDIPRIAVELQNGTPLDQVTRSALKRNPSVARVPGVLDIVNNSELIQSFLKSQWGQLAMLVKTLSIQKSIGRQNNEEVDVVVRSD